MEDVLPTHEPERRAPARRGEACPERADLEIGAPSTRFMVPMRAQRRMVATHEPRPLTPSPPLGERVSEGRVRGIATGSWSQCAASKSWRLSLHEPERRAPARRGAACPERADLEIGAPST